MSSKAGLLPGGTSGLLPNMRRRLGPSRISAAYLLVLMVVAFSVLEPVTFANVTTFKLILNNASITALVALAVVIPLAAGVFDLSIGYTMSLAGVVAAYVEVHYSLGTPASIAIALLASAAVGLLNSAVVVGMDVDSFIGTLACGSVVAAVVTLVTNEQDITSVKLTGSFAAIGQSSAWGLSIQVVYMVVIALAILVILDFTPTGRRLYAVGFNRQSSRLAGVVVDRVRAGALVTSAVLSGWAGVVLASTIGSGSPDSGSAFLLPAYAAAFLGATQIRPGRFNAVGTILAVLILVTGSTGLALGGAPVWGADMFTGVTLVLALTLTSGRTGVLRGLLARVANLLPSRATRDHTGRREEFEAEPADEQIDERATVTGSESRRGGGVHD